MVTPITASITAMISIPRATPKIAAVGIVLVVVFLVGERLSRITNCERNRITIGCASRCIHLSRAAE